MVKNIVWVVGIFVELFLEIRCLGRGVSLVGNDDDERECLCLWMEIGLGRRE